MAYPSRKGYPIVEFKKLNGCNVPLQPWPQYFYVSREFLEEVYGAVEVRPLTLIGLLKGVGRNFISMNFWRFCYLLRRAGFLTTKEGERFSIRHWNWFFWNA